MVLDNLAPTIAIDATLAGDNRVNAAEDNTFVVSGTTVGVENGQTVTVTLSDGSHPPVVTTATVSGGVWTATAADISGLTNGNITIHADVTDLAGNPAPGRARPWCSTTWRRPLRSTPRWLATTASMPPRTTPSLCPARPWASRTARPSR